MAAQHFKSILLILMCYFFNADHGIVPKIFDDQLPLFRTSREMGVNFANHWECGQNSSPLTKHVGQNSFCFIMKILPFVAIGDPK